MSVIIKTDKAKWRKVVGGASDLAAAALAEQVLNDSRQFVPRSDGRLRDTGRVEKGDKGTYYVVWDTVYALYQWFGMRADGSHKATHYTTAGTGSQWVEKAKAQYNSAWEKIAQKKFDEGLK